MYISVKAVRRASSETQTRLNAANTENAVAAVVCAAWAAGVEDHVVDAAALIIAANVNSIASRDPIRRKYRNILSYSLRETLL